jgi:hypothetical protein
VAVDRLASGPLLDLRAKPEFHAAFTEIDDRAGHVGVALLVDAHRVVARVAKDLGDAVSVDEVVDDKARSRQSYGGGDATTVRRGSCKMA